MPLPSVHILLHTTAADACDAIWLSLRALYLREAASAVAANQDTHRKDKRYTQAHTVQTMSGGRNEQSVISEYGSGHFVFSAAFLDSILAHCNEGC